MPYEPSSAPLSLESPSSEPCRPYGGVLDRSSNRLPWVKATGTPDTLSKKAAQYLRVFDYEAAARYDRGIMILAKVVCNLRHYHQQSSDQTVQLIVTLFNPKAWEVWSPEGIKLTWDLVASFTPSLGLSDEKAKAKHRATLIENEVIDLLAWTRPEGRVSSEELRTLFMEWNPDLPVTPREFAIAVKAATGQSTVAIHGTRYWVGFHLPTSEELVGSVCQPTKLLTPLRDKTPDPLDARQAGVGRA